MRADVVLSYPYSGALHHLLSREHHGRGPAPTGHPYYDNLYGPSPTLRQSNAVNLATLFENIILPAVDDFLPDYQTYWSGDTYFHPDLRIKVDRRWGADHEAREIAQGLMEDPEVQNVLNASQIPFLNDFSKRDLVAQIVAQLRLALKHGATMVGGEEASAIIRAVVSSIRSLDILVPGTETPPLITLPPSMLKLPGLDWQCDSLSNFATIRQSSEITAYASGYRSALLEASRSEEIVPRLEALMREARDKDQVAKHIKGGFETTGMWATLGGGVMEWADRLAAATGTSVDPRISVPINLALAGAGLISILGQKNAERKGHETRWYLLGAKMQEVAINALLSEGP